MILLTCKTLRETRLRIKAVRDITLTLTLTEIIARSEADRDYLSLIAYPKLDNSLQCWGQHI